MKLTCPACGYSIPVTKEIAARLTNPDDTYQVTCSHKDRDTRAKPQLMEVAK